MADREKVELEVRRSDGSSVVRMEAPRWSVSVAVGLFGLLLGGAGAIWGDYIQLRRHRADFDVLHSRVADQQRVIEAFESRARKARAEIDAWSELHEQIWQPLGPGAGPAPRGTGVGGSTAARHLEASPPAGSPLGEMDLLMAAVSDQGESLRALERFMSRAGTVLSALPSRWPVRGPVNSEFGRRPSPWTADSGAREFHAGLDIGAPVGTSVRAPAHGTVLFAGRVPEYGISLIIDHGNEIRSVYGHLSRLYVSQNELVERGQVVALTGNTGRSSGPHLHYEVLVQGRPVNPRMYLWD